MHAVKMVIGSNTCTQELAKLEHDDREWIKQNSVHVIMEWRIGIVAALSLQEFGSPPYRRVTRSTQHVAA